VYGPTWPAIVRLLERVIELTGKSEK